jgi:hypothetical protein
MWQQHQQYYQTKEELIEDEFFYIDDVNALNASIRMR